MTGASEKMLIQQVREMERDGIVSRKDEREVPPRVEDSLPPFGLSLTEELRPLSNWDSLHRDGIDANRSQADERQVLENC